MKAMVFEGKDKVVFKDVAKPTILKPTDAIVKITKTTICGTDLHIKKGDVPAVKIGTILGHEGIGIVEEVGSSVNRFKKGDKVIVSCVSACGVCDYCKKQLPAHCQDGGWILGHLIDGTMAEYVRTPHADNSLHKIPEGVSEEALVMLSDILPTGFEIGVRYGNVEPGSKVAIVGAGPIGMAILLTSQFYSPSQIIVIDGDANRLALAKKFGATDVIDITKVTDVVAEVKKLTAGVGVDVAIEAVGIPQTFDTCQNIICPGGRVANVGVHGTSVNLKLEELWIKNITITTGLVNANTTPMLLKTVVSGAVKPEQLITHRFKFSDFDKAFEIFANAAKEKAMKVLIEAD